MLSALMIHDIDRRETVIMYRDRTGRQLQRTFRQRASAYSYLTQRTQAGDRIARVTVQDGDAFSLPTTVVGS